MIRVILIPVVLAALPFVAYWIYRVTRRPAAAGDAEWSGDRITQLSIASALILIASFIYLSITNGAPEGSTYVPAEYRDGEIVPGRFE